MSAISVILSGGAAAFAVPEPKDPSLASEPQSHDLPAATKASSTPGWERIGNFIVLLAYSCVVLSTVRYHEKWADEAQAWLIARDLPLSRIWFYELRYEGSPGLWHTILWIAQHWFHAPYSALGSIGVAFAIAGAAVLIFKAPFPWYVRWPLAFTYVMVYQYAVIARPYTLLPLLCFLVAILFKDIEHPERMTVVLVLLAMLTLHGSILAGCFGLLYLIEPIKSWGTLPEKLRTRYFVCGALIILTFMFLFLILKPTPDVGEFAAKDEWAKQFKQPTRSQKLLSLLYGAFFDNTIASTVFIVLASFWCFTRRRFALFVLPVGLLIGLYTLVHGYAHHHGTVFIAAITALWVAWPSKEETVSLDVRSRSLLWGVTALLTVLCAVNIWDAAVSIQREYLYPYSGATDAARYLRSVGADKQTMFGYLFGIVGVQAEFDHNIFLNMPTTFFHLGAPFKGTHLDMEEFARVNPEYLVIYSNDPQLTMDTDGPTWAALGYRLVHISDGYYLYKRLVYQREVYLIFRRTPTPDAGPK
jgi:hypothetical protein